MKLLGSSKRKITKDKNGGHVPHLEITEVILVSCSIVNNNHQHNVRVLYAFIPNKSFDHLLEVSPKNFIFLKSFNSAFSCIEV